MIVDWYFDFVSPFAYLQSEELGSLPPRVAVRYRPVLFAGLLGANGQKGPAEIPAKRAFTYRFCLWRAKSLGIPLRFPPEHPFNPLPLLRLAIACDSTADAVHRIFRFVWRDGRLPDLPIEWAELAGSLGVPDADARIATAEVKDELRRNTDEAIARGVFGVPNTPRAIASSVLRRSSSFIFRRRDPRLRIRLPDLPIEWAELAVRSATGCGARIATPEVKDELRRNTDEAIARRVRHSEDTAGNRRVGVLPKLLLHLRGRNPRVAHQAGRALQRAPPTRSADRAGGRPARRSERFDAPPRASNRRRSRGEAMAED